jgi:RHS repeat-associated protein
VYWSSWGRLLPCGSDQQLRVRLGFFPHSWAGADQVCTSIPWPGEATTVRHQLETAPNIQNWFGGLVDNMRDASGQLYMRNRYYDPQSGQFTQPDPIGLAGGLNAYGFAEGDPVTYSDPYGLCKRDKNGHEDPDCRSMIRMLNAAADDADRTIPQGSPNYFRDAAQAYEATNRDVQFVSPRDRRLNRGGNNTDSNPENDRMGRTMDDWGLPFGPSGEILIRNDMGRGDMVMTGAHEILAHDKQKMLTDLSPRIDDLNTNLWVQLPRSWRTSAPMWNIKMN